MMLMRPILPDPFSLEFFQLVEQNSFDSLDPSPFHVHRGRWDGVDLASPLSPYFELPKITLYWLG